LSIDSQQVAVGGEYHVERVVEGCIRALPVGRPFLPIACKRADDGARLGHGAEGVVAPIHHHHAAGPVYS